MTLSAHDEHARARAGIRLIFLTQAIASVSFFTRIPDIQEGLGISEGTLGLALIGQPVGAIIMFLFASRIIEGIGTKPVMLWGIPLLAIAVLVTALAPDPMLLFAALALFGASFAVTNVALNVEADRVEAMTDRRLMNSCHGIWSLGQLAGVSLAPLIRGLDVPVAWHFGVAVPIAISLTLYYVLPMRPAPPRAHALTGKVRRISLPTLPVILILGFFIGGGMVEAAVRQWSVIFMRDSFDAPAWVDTLTLPVFIGAVAVSRLFADRVIARFGPVPTARGLMLVALAGLGLVVLSPALPVALAGFALLGIGVCVSFPLSTSAAARIGDRPASQNVASLTMSSQIVLLGAPALLGYVASGFDIRTAFTIVAPVLVVALLLAGSLRQRTPAHSPDGSA